jgi:isoquinoline 1-oxidoreductase beta subunit
MGAAGKWTRRAFVVTSAAIAGGVAFGYWRYKTPYENPLLADLEDGENAITPYVLIDQSGITIIAPRSEMGQGVHTTLAALVAEELDVALSDVKVEHGPASKVYYNAKALEEGLPIASTNVSDFAEGVRDFVDVPAKLLGMQMTGGSTSTPDAYHRMRKAGAAARIALLQAAAERLGTDAASLRTDNGYVVATDGSRVPYTELAEAAALIEPHADPELKPRSEWTQLGRSLPRVDMHDKCTGDAEYSIDVRLPGMLYATVKMNPGLGGAMNGYDATAAQALPGVRKILPLEGGVAVIATNTWYAFKAANAIEFDWAEAPYPPTSAEQFAAVEAAFDGGRDSRFRNDGDVEKSLIEGADVEQEYRVPYLAHATMEPLNAVALLENGRLDIWVGTQAPTEAAKAGADVAGIDVDDVRVHTMYMGGGFGRRAEMDFVKSAVRVAREMEGTPIKMTWSREEDMTHDTYRPLAIARVRAKLEDGQLDGLDLDLSVPSVLEDQMGRLGIPIAGPDVTIVQAAFDQPYTIPNYRVTGYRAPIMVPVSSWRSVGGSQNGFFHESAIDEVAHAAGKDPLDLRLELIDHAPSRKVIEAAADMANWGAPLREGHGMGLAFVLSFGVPVAEIVEVADTDRGIRILNVWAAVDVGTALDPRNVEAQVQSGVNFGLAAAMMGSITIRDGMIEQRNFDTFDAMRMSQAPDIKVRILENGEKIRGIGEPGTPPAAPALANAIFAATGRRIRELPLNKHMRFA